MVWINEGGKQVSCRVSKNRKLKIKEGGFVCGGAMYTVLEVIRFFRITGFVGIDFFTAAFTLIDSGKRR